MNKDTSAPQWKIIGSTYVVDDRWLKVRADTLLSPEGKTITPWYVMEYSDWVACLVIDQEDNVILLDHYRHGVNRYVTELIGGVMDADDNSATETVERELHEEIGLQNAEIHKTGVMYASPSNQNNKAHSFLALGGTIQGEQHHESEADFTIRPMPFKEFYAMITNPTASEPLQGPHIATIFYCFNFIKNTLNPSEQILRLRSML